MKRKPANSYQVLFLKKLNYIQRRSSKKKWIAFKWNFGWLIDISLETPMFRRHFSSQGVVIIQGETLTWISAIFRQNSAQNSANFAFITFTPWYNIDFWTSGLWNNRPFTDFELHTSLVWSDILVIIREQQFQYCLVWGSFCWALDKEKIRLSISKPSSHQRHKQNDTT